jgi:hypothetical protein
MSGSPESQSNTKKNAILAFLADTEHVVFMSADIISKFSGRLKKYASFWMKGLKNNDNIILHRFLQKNLIILDRFHTSLINMINN